MKTNNPTLESLNVADLRVKDAAQFTPAFYAVMDNDLPLLDLYRQKDKTLLNDVGFFDGTLLHYAAHSGSTELIQYLLDQGLEVDARSINQETPLEWAMYKGNANVIQVLVDHGAQVQHVFDIWGNSVLTAAVLTNNAACVHALIQQGADVNETNAEGRTPLHTAVGPANERIDIKMVTLLLAYGAEVNAELHQGVSVLMWAVKYGNADIVRLLLQKGAHVMPKNLNAKSSVLHNALLSNQPEIVEMILEVTEALDFKDDSGKTPLMLAVEKGRLDIVKQLMDRKADCNIKEDYFGKTALHQAYISGYEDIAAYLLAQGATPNALDHDNKTPLDYAAKKNLPSPAQAFDDNQAGIWYLGHSGWAVKTQNHLLVFDYSSNSRVPQNASLATGYIVPEELKDLNVTFFVSNLCPDHFDPFIYECAKTIKNCTYVYGFNPSKIHPYTGPDYLTAGLNQTQWINDIEVTTLLSNVGGAGFCVSVDGITLFHPGDHSERTKDHSGPFCGEIDFIAAKQKPVDIAFLPIQGDYLAEPSIVHAGNVYILQKLRPALVFPMHADGKEHLYQAFKDTCSSQFPDIACHGARHRGDFYRYQMKP